MIRRYTVALTLSAGVASGASVVATLPAAMDATLYEDADGAYASGEGAWLFSGRTRQAGNSLRRATLFFDVADSLPENARILSAELRLFVSQTISGDSPVSLHRALTAWGEGPSNASGIGGGGTGAVSLLGDATWIHARFPGDLWTAPGGDFAPDPVAVASAGGISDTVPVTWSSDALTSSVQLWVDDPAANLGWILLGDEGSPGSAKRFNSSENPDAATRPQLLLCWTIVPEPSTLTLIATAAAILGRRRKPVS